MSTNPKVKQKKVKTIEAADLWCGGGGTSTGLMQAAIELGLKVELTAINHWEIAVATHSKNHPDARHFCKAVDSVNPLDLYKSRKLDLLLASPECVHHSRARGGKPRDEQKRADAWDLQRWIEKLFVKTIIIENVREFVDWGPLGEDGKPLKSKKGVYFNQFVSFLKILYTVEWRIINCADYGDPTTRERFFLIAKRGKSKKILFPAPSHASRKVLAKKQPDLFNPEKVLKPWIPARDIINWNLEGKNIFGRKKPLSENTMKRIYAGLRKFSGIDIPERQLSDDPNRQAEFDQIYQTSPIKIDFSKFNGFVMGTGGPTGQMQPRSIDEPVRTILTDHRQNIFEPAIEPFLFNQKATDRRMRSIDEPAFTQTANSHHQYVVQPYFFNLEHNGKNARKSDGTYCYSLDRSIPTIAGKGMFGVVEPYIVPCNHGKNDLRAHSINEPMKTVTGVDGTGLIEPYLVQYFGGMNAVSVDNPVPTITANYEHYALAEPFLVKYHGNEKQAHSVDNPLSTITTKDRCALIEPFIAKFNNNQDALTLDEPLPTVTTKDKCGLGEPFMIQFYGERNGQNPRTRDIDSPVWTVTPQIRMGIVEPFLVKLENAEKEIHGLLLLELGCILVVNFRMLHQTELSAAMSFPPDYYFHGTRDQQVKQIGNAVPVKTAKSLIRSVLENV